MVPYLSVPSSDLATRVGRAQGCLLGQLAGDSLGSLVEFSTASEIARAYPDGPTTLMDGGVWSTLAGQPTDDSELALALARSLVAKGCYDRAHVAAAYATWLDSNPFDVGNTTAMALSPALWALKNNAPADQAAIAAANPESQANGALMRISPLAIFGHAKSSETLMDLARTDAALTHPHPVCQDANALFTAMLAYAIRSADNPKHVYQFALDLAEGCNTVKPVRDRLTAAALAPPPEVEGGKMGWVLVAFQNALYQLLHAPSAKEGIIATVRLGGDTDTNAAIAGALLGAVYNRDSLPQQWQDKILSCRPSQGATGVKRPRPEAYWPTDALTLAENLVLAGQG